MHPHPCPTWQSYIFPETVEPNEAPVVIEQTDIINLTNKFDANGSQ
jgi:hypothetical protein